MEILPAPIGSPRRQHAGGMKEMSRSVTAVRNADEGNHRIAIPIATRPVSGREKDNHAG